MTYYQNINTINLKKIRKFWRIFSLTAAFTSLLIFGVFGFFTMLQHESVIFTEPNKMIAFIELTISLLAMAGIFYSLLLEYNLLIKKD